MFVKCVNMCLVLVMLASLLAGQVCANRLQGGLSGDVSLFFFSPAQEQSKSEVKLELRDI